MPGENITKLEGPVGSNPVLSHGVLETDGARARPHEMDDIGNLKVTLRDGDGAEVSTETPAMSGQAPQTVNVTVLDTVIIPANPNRKALVMTNDSDTTIYISVTNALAGTSRGIRLNANGGAYTLSKYGSVFSVDEVHGIHGGAGNKALTYQEYE